MTTAQSQVLGFEDASAWSANNASLAFSGDVTEGSAALAVQVHGHTVLSSNNIEAPGSIKAQATFDLKLLQTVQWGDARLIVVMPSQGHSERDVGSVNLGGLSSGVFHLLTFALPGDLITTLESGSSDLSFKIVLNAPPESEFVLDNLVLSDGGPQNGGGNTNGTEIAYELTLPDGVSLSNTVLASSEFMKIEDGVFVTGDQDFDIVNVGVGLMEVGADAQLGLTGQNVNVMSGGDVFLRSRGKIKGDLTAALAITTQDMPLDEAVSGSANEQTPMALAKPLTWSVSFSEGNTEQHWRWTRCALFSLAAMAH